MSNSLSFGMGGVDMIFCLLGAGFLFEGGVFDIFWMERAEIFSCGFPWLVGAGPVKKSNSLPGFPLCGSCFAFGSGECCDGKFCIDLGLHVVCEVCFAFDSNESCDSNFMLR